MKSGPSHYTVAKIQPVSSHNESDSSSPGYLFISGVGTGAEGAAAHPGLDPTSSAPGPGAGPVRKRVSCRQSALIKSNNQGLSRYLSSVWFILLN